MAYSVTFRSPFPSLRVTFPPEQFDQGFDVEGKPAPFKPIKFNQGGVALDSEKAVQLMRKHPGNESNGGDSFWEEKPAVSLALEEISRNFKPSASIPAGGVPTELNDRLLYLEKKSVKFLASEVPEVLSALIEIIDAFHVTGILSPDKDIKGPRLKARVIECLGILEDCGISPIE